MNRWLLALITTLTIGTQAHASLRFFNSSGTELGNFSEAKCSTGMTCAVTSGRMVLSSSAALTGPFTMENDEVITNATDDVIEVQSNDEHTTFQITGYEAKNAILNLYADQGDDSSDKFSIKADTSNVLSILNNTTTLLSSSSAGLFTYVNGDMIDNATTDDKFDFLSEDNDTTVGVTGFESKDAILQLWADQGDDAADKYSLTADASTNSLTFKNNATSILTMSSAGVLTLADSESVTNASDVVTFAFDDAAADVRVKAFEATDAKFLLQADESDDNGDDWQFASVASGNALTISNDTSGSQVAKVTIAASDGDMTLTGGITGDGGDTVSGFLQAQVASTTTGITAAQCGSTFVSNSADVMTLPEASTVLGCRLTFVCGTADDFDINPADGTDQIGPALNSVAAGTGAAITPSAGDAIRCTDIGSSIVLEAVGADLWAPIGVGNGAWTDVN